jgi:hypothetical protein
MNIKTEYVYPPIPVRDLDWQACVEGWEPGDPIGVGATEKAAIADLMDQMGEIA